MAVISITIDGVDVTPIVEYRTVEFVTQVNGVPGSCSFRIKDMDHDQSFIVGSVILLQVDSQNVWQGFLTGYRRQYSFEYQDTADLGTVTRHFLVEGSDINVLFSKRFTFNQDDPNDFEGIVYPASPPTHDQDAIADLVDGWLDLTGDGLDTSSLVEYVGNINVDQAARAWTASWTWGQAMLSIATLPAAIFYIDPDRNLVYTDVDTPNSPYVLSDVAGEGVGYRRMEIENDGSALANDVMAWGFGMGSANPVFHRRQDAASIAEHGLWQMGQIKYDVYKQATIEKVTDSIVNGSPQSKRGHKIDRFWIQCTTFQNGFRAAQKVRFVSSPYGIDLVIPIRQMRITFPTPTDAQYRLTLSHDIDAPWNFFDPIPPIRYVPTDIRFPPIRKRPLPPEPSPCPPTTISMTTGVGGFSVLESGYAFPGVIATLTGGAGLTFDLTAIEDVPNNTFYQAWVVASAPLLAVAGGFSYELLALINTASIDEEFGAFPGVVIGIGAASDDPLDPGNDPNGPSVFDQTHRVYVRTINSLSINSTFLTVAAVGDGGFVVATDSTIPVGSRVWLRIGLSTGGASAKMWEFGMAESTGVTASSGGASFPIRSLIAHSVVSDGITGSSATSFSSGWVIESMTMIRSFGGCGLFPPGCMESWYGPVVVGYGNGIATEFVLPYVYTAGTLVVYVDGVATSVTETGSQSFTFVTAPPIGAVITATWFVPFVEEEEGGGG